MSDSDGPHGRIICADEIKARVKDGRYPPGEWLPSLHRLSVDLGASEGPVWQALVSLSENGLITRVKGRGYYPGDEQPRHRRLRPRRRVEHPSRSSEEISALLAKPWITPTELRTFLKVSKMRVYRAISAGEIPDAVRIGRIICLPSGGVEVYLKNCGVKGPGEPGSPPVNPNSGFAVGNPLMRLNPVGGMNARPR